MMNYFLNLIWQVEPSGPLLLRSEKIYTVMAVLLVIFVALIAYLLVLDRKITRMEKQVDELPKAHSS